MNVPVLVIQQELLHQLCADTGCNLEDLLGQMDNRERERERERELRKFMLSAQLDNNDEQCAKKKKKELWLI